MFQDITITNITDTLGNTPEIIENLNVTTTQAYFLHQNEDILPGAPTEVFPTETIDPALQITLSDPDGYFIPLTVFPGLDRTILDLEFNFVGDPRLLKITLPYASIWCPPEEINEGYPIDGGGGRRRR